MFRTLGGAGHKVTFYERDTVHDDGHRDLPHGDDCEIVVHPEHPHGQHDAVTLELCRERMTAQHTSERRACELVALAV
jgi:hypothetical protein